MGDTANKWLMGCGIGCGAVILICALLFGGCWYFGKHISRGFDQATKTEDELDARFGPVKAYVPPLDGVVTPERMNAFLAVRDSIAPLRGDIEKAFASFERAERMGRQKDFKAILDAVRGGVSIAPLAGDFYRKRNAALLAHDMGLGEYTYIYCLAYFNFLHHKPEAGPRGMRSEDNESGYSVRGRVHRRMLEVLSNLQKALDKEPAAGSKTFRESVNEEVGAMLADDARLPWPKGLPPAIAAGFEPFAQRLEATYSPATNIFELGSRFRSRRGGFRFESGETDSTETD